MEIGEPLRSEKMEVDENQQLSKRKISMEMPEKNENVQPIKSLNEFEIIEAIFQVKIQSDKDPKLDNSIFTVHVDPIFLNCKFFRQNLKL